MGETINLIKNDISTLIFTQNYVIAKVFLSIQKYCKFLERRKIHFKKICYLLQSYFSYDYQKKKN